MVLKLIFLSLIGSAISKILQDDLMLEALDEDFLFPNNEVPNYEIVPVFASAVEENGSRKVKINLRTFGKDLEMWVHPVEGVLATTRTPVYTVRNGVKLKRQRNAMKKVIEKLYHNKRFLASVTVNEAPSREVMVHGIFGLYNYFIRPLYDSELYYTYLKNNAYPKWSNFSYHMIYKLPDIPKYIKALIPPKMKPKKWSQVPQTIYPEIMVIVDYPLFKLLKKNLKDTLGYILSFWNGVDLRYRSLQNPNYRLNIAGVIISETSQWKVKITIFSGENETNAKMCIRVVEIIMQKIRVLNERKPLQKNAKECKNDFLANISRTAGNMKKMFE